MDTETETIEAPKLARQIFETWTEEPNICVFDAFNLRKAVGSASSILLAHYNEQNGRLCDKLAKIWDEACYLDDQAKAIAEKAKALRKQALEILA